MKDKTIFLEETLLHIKPLNKNSMDNKKSDIDSLLKTPHGLGKLEKIAIQLEGIESFYKIRKKAVIVMAADNGVENEGVSASSRKITQVVVKAMVEGKACISSLCKTLGSELFIVDLGIDMDEPFSEVINRRIMPKGTNNIRYNEAMSYDQTIEAIEVGIKMVRDLSNKNYNLLAVGEMGIGNTTTSSACLKSLTNLPLIELVGYGSGIDDKTLGLKIQVIEDALKINAPDSTNVIDIIQKVGGLDIAAMTGVFIGAARYRIPIVIDGLISGISALFAYKLNPLCKEFMIPSHISEEPGAKWIMKELAMDPMLYMDMKLGEGSGAVLLFPIIEASCNFTKDVKKYPLV